VLTAEAAKKAITEEHWFGQTTIWFVRSCMKHVVAAVALIVAAVATARAQSLLLATS
jgi:hypothetical protein